MPQEGRETFHSELTFFFFKFVFCNQDKQNQHSSLRLKFVVLNSLPLELSLGDIFFPLKSSISVKTKVCLHLLSAGHRRYHCAGTAVPLCHPLEAQILHKTQTYQHKTISSGSHLMWVVLSLLVSPDLGE